MHPITIYFITHTAPGTDTSAETEAETEPDSEVDAEPDTPPTTDTVADLATQTVAVETHPTAQPPSTPVLEEGATFTTVATMVAVPTTAAAKPVVSVTSAVLPPAPTGGTEWVGIGCLAPLTKCVV